MPVYEFYTKDRSFKLECEKDGDARTVAVLLIGKDTVVKVETEDGAVIWTAETR